MNLQRQLGVLLVTSGLVLHASTAVGQATGPRAKVPLPPASDGNERASGVIIKAESPSKPGDKATDSTPIRLTINTAAVWRDWARDQAPKNPKTPREAAKDGQDSVATRGEPRS